MGVLFHFLVGAGREEGFGLTDSFDLESKSNNGVTRDNYKKNTTTVNQSQSHRYSIIDMICIHVFQFQLAAG